MCFRNCINFRVTGKVWLDRSNISLLVYNEILLPIKFIPTSYLFYVFLENHSLPETKITSNVRIPPMYFDV